MSLPSPQITVSSSLARNSVVLTAGFAVTALLLLLNDLVVIDIYGPSVHGRVTLALSLAIAGYLLCDLGLASKAGVRTIAQLRATGSQGLGVTIGRMVTTLLLIGLLASIAMSIASPWVAGRLGLDAFELRQASIWLFAGAGIRACAMVFIGLERMAFVAALGVLAEGARLVWTLLCGGLAFDVRYLYLGWSATWVVSLLVCMGCVAVLLGAHGVRIVWWPPPAEVERSLRWREVRDALPYLPPLLTNQALPPLLIVLAGFALGWRGVAETEAADQLSVLRVCIALAMVVRMVSQAIATSLFPLVARRAADAGAGRLADLLRPFHRSVLVLAMLSVGALVVYALLGAWGLGLIDRLNGTTIYTSGYAALLILTAAIAIDSYRLQADQLLMGIGDVRVVMVGELLKAVLLFGAIPAGVFLYFAKPDTGASLAVLVLVTSITLWRGVAMYRRLRVWDSSKTETNA